MIKQKMAVDKLAQITANQFAHVDERLDSLGSKIDAGFAEMKSTLKTVLDVVLEIPSKKAFRRLDDKVQMFDARLTSVERKIGGK